MGYSDRIVGLERVRAGDLLANEANWRTHPDSQVSALRGLLSEVGWAQALLAYRSNGDLKLIDGHLRAGLDPDEQVPVLILDVDDAEAEKLLVSIDPLAAMAEADSQALRGLLERVETADAGLMALLADLNAQAAPKQGRTDPDDVPEDVEPRTKPGDLWLMGEHRLLCGDATNRDDYERLLDDAGPLSVLTYPPYGVGKGFAGEEGDPAPLMRAFVAALPDSVGALVAFQSTRTFPGLLDAARDAGFTFERMFWLYKPNDMTFPWRSWILKSEAICVFSRPGAQWEETNPYSHDCYVQNLVSGGPKTDTGKMPEGHHHPTIKPYEVVEDLLRRIGGAVLDPFAGSGTTLIAAEKLGRTCYAMELAPDYCDVVVARWEAFTGGTAVLA